MISSDLHLPDSQFKLKGHHAAVLWFTGLSGSGKTTLAKAVEAHLFSQYRAHTSLLDGDVIRQGLNRDLGFSDRERTENIRRIAEVARLMASAGLITLTSFISPFNADRLAARQIIQPYPFIEIYVRCPLPVCEQRDPKGLYQRARQGEIKQFTGIESFYEEPQHPDLVLNTDIISVEDGVQKILLDLLQRSIVGAS